eukprot:959915_1
MAHSLPFLVYCVCLLLCEYASKSGTIVDNCFTDVICNNFDPSMHKTRVRHPRCIERIRQLHRFPNHSFHCHLPSSKWYCFSFTRIAFVSSKISIAGGKTQ